MVRTLAAWIGKYFYTDGLVMGASEHPSDLNEENPDTYPTREIFQIWMEFWWRRCLDHRQVARGLCALMGTKRPSRMDFRRFALTPRPGGGTHLKPSKAFDVFAPDGYFRTEILPRYADTLKANLAHFMHGIFSRRREGASEDQCRGEGRWQ